MNCLYCSRPLIQSFHNTNHFYCDKMYFLDYADSKNPSTFSSNGFSHAIIKTSSNKISEFHLYLINQHRNWRVELHDSNLMIYEFKRFYPHHILMVNISNISVHSLDDVPSLCQRFLDLQAFS